MLQGGGSGAERGGEGQKSFLDLATWRSLVTLTRAFQGSCGVRLAGGGRKTGA